MNTQMSREMSREMSEMYGKQNEVDISKFLSSIHIFHEVLCEEYPHAVQGHPHIELFDDGSGKVMNQRGLYIDGEYVQKPLFEFINLKELVAEADRLTKKYNIKWVD